MHLVTRLPILLVLTLAASGTAAQDWFTISGYPELPDSDVVQISPTLSTWQHQVTLEVRTTRKTERAGYGGVRYRSYSGMAVVDCDLGKGWFLTLTFFSQTGWQGEPIKTVNYRGDEAPMVFSDIPGNPAEKLIRAACAASR